MRNTPLPAARLDHLGDLLAFVRVADAQSFTAAADKLGLSRSAIGKCIARLEQGLGARLLHRSTRSVSLSDEGRVFYAHALRILAEVENAADAMDSRRQAPRGRLRLDLPVSLGRLHVMPLLRDYLREWPEVEADVSFSDDYADLVRDGIDVAIRIGGDPDSRLVQRVLAPHRLITCASPAYLERHGAPATPDDLARHRTVARRLRLGDTEALRDAALAGEGIAQLGAFLVGADLRAGRLQAVLESVAPAGAPVCAVYPHRRHLAPKVRVLIDGIARAWRAGPPWAAGAAPGPR